MHEPDMRAHMEGRHMIYEVSSGVYHDTWVGHFFILDENGMEVEV